ncbi:uncharacterized protein LOC114317700 [Camellia sinensis]|uniref:uncharacterized protein LOC114317700 n=1 Tax=Camellia sinensis TaxID=4442 RepID=UPI00103573FC|nr:uncharacterized protein LOC114317700 [Camellia sinensis]
MDPQEGSSAGGVCNGQINTWIRETIGEMEMTTSMIWLEIARVANEYAYVDRTPFHTSALTGRLWMQEMLTGREEAFQRNFRMPRDVFIKLCNTLVADFGLELPQRPHGIDVVESVGMFIYVLRGFPSWDIENRFQHSGETVWRHFKRVLRAMKEFTRAHCRPTRPQNSRHPYLESQPKYLPFRDCIGALDGTHVEANLNPREAPPYFGRKGRHTQNILAVCDFDLCFTFISCGWEGSMHDSRVFNEVTEDPVKKFPHPVEGKYYLVDAGYKNQKGFLAPFKGCRYHQEQFHVTGRARNANEVFNTVHSSLRSAIERTFGVWKARWGFLHNMPRYDFGKVQVPLVGASMALHNFIRRNSNEDEAFNKVANADHFIFSDMPNAAGVGDDDELDPVGDDDI